MHKVIFLIKKFRSFKDFGYQITSALFIVWITVWLYGIVFKLMWIYKMFFGKVLGCIEVEVLAKSEKYIPIQKHRNNFNRDDSFKLSPTWIKLFKDTRIFYA